MCIEKEKKKVTLRFEILHRAGEVTFAASNGSMVNVHSNDLGVALGMVFAKTIVCADNFWATRAKNFDMNIELILH